MRLCSWKLGVPATAILFAFCGVAAAQQIADFSTLATYGEAGQKVADLVTKRDYDGALEQATSLLSSAQKQPAKDALQAVVASLRRNSQIKADVIAGVRAGKRERVYVEFSRSVMAGKLLSADPEKLVVQILGNAMPFPWKDLSDRRFYAIARKYIGKDQPQRHLALAAYCIETSLRKEAHAQLDEAVRADGSLAAQAKALRALIRSTAPIPEAVSDAKMTPRRIASGIKKAPASSAVTTRAAAGRYEGVHPSHPRLFLRDAPWAGGTGLTVARLRQRARASPWKETVARLSQGRATTACRALKWLATGDTKAAEDAIGRLQRKTTNGGTTIDGDDLENAAVAFDWLFNYPGFDRTYASFRTKRNYSPRRT